MPRWFEDAQMAVNRSGPRDWWLAGPSKSEVFLRLAQATLEPNRDCLRPFPHGALPGFAERVVLTRESERFHNRNAIRNAGGAGQVSARARMQGANTFTGF